MNRLGLNDGPKRINLEEIVDKYWFTQNFRRMKPVQLLYRRMCKHNRKFFKKVGYKCGCMTNGRQVLPCV